jgi:hypothetical protein
MFYITKEPTTYLEHTGTSEVEIAATHPSLNVRLWGPGFKNYNEDLSQCTRLTKEKTKIPWPGKKTFPNNLYFSITENRSQGRIF